MARKEILLPSNDGVHKLHVVIWEPEGVARAVVQISHGMVEHIGRYSDFAAFLCENGFVVIGNDHLGHGRTAANNADFGYFCPEHRSATVVKDIHKVTRYAKSRYKNMPYFLLAHSMGSFLARRYLMTYGGELDGTILLGTGGQKESVLITGMIYAKLMSLFVGERHRSEFVKKQSFHTYLDRIPDHSSENEWISRDKNVVAAYDADELCSFNFTLNGYYTLFEVIDYIQKKKNIQKIPKDMPIFFASGEEDPVGGYGKWVRQIVDEYKKAGIKNIKLKMYKNDRHELLNELDREVVYADILNWLLELS